MVTYALLVSSLQPTKAEEHRVRITVVGYHLDFLGLTSTNTESLTTLKLLLNSVISTLNSRFMTMDIKIIIMAPLWRAMNTCPYPWT